MPDAAERLIRHLINYSNATRNDISELLIHLVQAQEDHPLPGDDDLRRMAHRFQTEEIKRISFIKAGSETKMK